MRRIAAVLFCWLALGLGHALAVTPQEMLQDQTLEARARALSEELRCMVCQNQSIDDSDAPLAHDLRVLLRERLSAGDSDQQAIDYLVARYGEFILLKPRVNLHTILLWVTPFAVLFIGAGGIAYALRRPGTRASAELSPDEKARVARITGTAEAEQPARFEDSPGSEGQPAIR